MTHRPIQNTVPQPNGTDKNVVAPNRKLARKQKEVGGPTGPEPTRYGDWERKGRCVDF